MGIDWTFLYKKYRSLWVALKDDERTVVASGRTAKKAWSDAKKTGVSNPILTRVPGKLISYVGGSR